MRVGAAPHVIELVPTANIAAGETSRGLGQVLQARWPDAEVVRIGADGEAPLLDARPVVLVLRDARRHPWQQAIAREVVTRSAAAIVVETGLPGWAPEGAKGVLETYGSGRVNLEAAAAASSAASRGATRCAPSLRLRWPPPGTFRSPAGAGRTPPWRRSLARETTRQRLPLRRWRTTAAATRGWRYMSAAVPRTDRPERRALTRAGGRFPATWIPASDSRAIRRCHWSTGCADAVDDAGERVATRPCRRADEPSAARSRSRVRPRGTRSRSQSW